MTRNNEKLERQEYMLLHPFCAVCHWPAQRPGRWMELLHIVGGPGRKDMEENWITLCARCHRAVHDKLPEYGEIPKGAILTAKQEVDGHVDLKKLAGLVRKQALSYDMCPIPEKFVADRRKNGGRPWP